MLFRHIRNSTCEDQFQKHLAVLEFESMFQVFILGDLFAIDFQIQHEVPHGPNKGWKEFLEYGRVIAVVVNFGIGFNLDVVG